MHMGKSILRQSGFVVFAILSFCLAAPALAGHDPLAFAKGVWQGEADNGQEKLAVTVTVKRAGPWFPVLPSVRV